MDTYTSHRSPASLSGCSPCPALFPLKPAIDARAASLTRTSARSKAEAQVAAGGPGALRRECAASRSDCGTLFQVVVSLIVGLALAATATADSRLEYFGFSGGCESETFVQETAPFSNLCVINIQDQRLLDHEWVAKMTVRDVKLMVATHDTFY